MTGQTHLGWLASMVLSLYALMNVLNGKRNAECQVRIDVERGS